MRYYSKYRDYGLPSRLINVMVDDQSEVKLVDIRDQQRYITLSYCWGTSQRIITTRDNFTQMQKGIKIDSLTKAIQDAIIFSRMFRIRYLWVDALCIIQKSDNSVDWSLESKKMAPIYAQLHVTLGAASVDSANESFLSVPRFPFVEVPFRETARSPSLGHLLFSLPSFDFAEHFERATYGSPLAKRGWTKQERLLSRRFTHFTTSQIYWECMSSFRAENGETTGPIAYGGSMEATLLRSVWSLANTARDTDADATKYHRI